MNSAIQAYLAMMVALVFVLSSAGCTVGGKWSNAIANRGKAVNRELTTEEMERDFAPTALQLKELESGAIVPRGVEQQSIPLEQVLDTQYATSPFESIICDCRKASRNHTDPQTLHDWCIEKNVNLIDHIPHGRFDAPDYIWKVERQ